MTRHSPIRHLPWYVGQTCEMTFEGRLTKSDHKERDHDILNKLAWKPHKKPVLIIAFIDGTNLTRDELGGLESYLIKDAKRMNPLLAGLERRRNDEHRHRRHRVDQGETQVEEPQQQHCQHAAVRHHESPKELVVPRGISFQMQEPLHKQNCGHP